MAYLSGRFEGSTPVQDGCSSRRPHRRQAGCSIRGRPLRGSLLRGGPGEKRPRKLIQKVERRVVKFEVFLTNLSS